MYFWKSWNNEHYISMQHSQTPINDAVMNIFINTNAGHDNGES